MKKIISLFLVLIVLFSATACSKPGKNDGENNNQVTEKFVLENGQTDYAIVIPENSISMENIASEELLTFFYEATGVRLPIINDSTVTYSSDAKYISIGKTKLVEQANITAPVELETPNSLYVKTVGNSIFCLGGADYGVAYSVYELLYEMLNFEYFYADCYTLDKSVTDIPLVNYDIVDSPDIIKPIGSVGYMVSNPTVARRMRAPYTYNIWMGDSGVKYEGHNTLHYLPPKEHYETHPKWFSSDQEAICYTAHGDEEELELMYQAFANRLKKVIIYNHGSERSIAKISAMDVYTSCTCDACQELLDYYGTDAGGYVIFMKELYRRIRDWMDYDEEGKIYNIPDFKIALSAYYKFEKAPSYYDETSGEWLPVDDKVVMGEGLTVAITPIFTNFTKSIYHEDNKTFYDIIMGWENIAQETSSWLYCTNFSHYMFPYDTYGSMQDYYQLLKKLNCVYFNDQTQNGNTAGMTGWHILKAYLFSKLAYDTEADINELTDRFFDAYFGEASEDMRKFYDSWRSFAQYQQNELGAFQGTYTVNFNIGQKMYWPKPIIDKWEGYIYDALEKIESIKNVDAKRYERLYKYILMEKVFPDYVLINFYQESLGSGVDKYKRTFIEGVELNNINRTKESGVINTYIKELKQSLGDVYE